MGQWTSYIKYTKLTHGMKSSQGDLACQVHGAWAHLSPMYKDSNKRRWMTLLEICVVILTLHLIEIRSSADKLAATLVEPEDLRIIQCKYLIYVPSMTILNFYASNIYIVHFGLLDCLSCIYYNDSCTITKWK